MRGYFSLISILAALFLSACANTRPQYDPNASLALNVVTAAGLTGLKDSSIDLSRHNGVDGWDAGYAATTSIHPLLDIPPGASLGLGALALLSASNDTNPAETLHYFAWIPDKAIQEADIPKVDMSKNIRARIIMSEIIGKAIGQAMWGNDFFGTKVVVVNARLFGKNFFVYTMRKGCPLTGRARPAYDPSCSEIVDAGLRYKTSHNIDAPLPAPAFLSKYPSVLGPLDVTITSVPSIHTTDGVKYWFSSPSGVEHLLNTSRHLPDWVFIYVPRLVKNGPPVLLRQGKILHFVKQND